VTRRRRMLAMGHCGVEKMVSWDKSRSEVRELSCGGLSCVLRTEARRAHMRELRTVAFPMTNGY
jgi:hypothetical protein